jgi:V/A-type H+/Na+-transporting ATPase subunit K
LTLLAFQPILLGSVIFTSVKLVNAQTGGLALPSDIDWGQMASFLAIGAGLAVGLSVLGAGYAIKTTGTAAISVLGENESGFFKAFLVVALGEALAIYGLIVAILLWTKIPDYTQFTYTVA